MIIFILVLVLIILILFTVTTFFLVTTIWAEVSRIGKPNAPFVPLPHSALAATLEYIELSSDSVVYDLGCGDGRVLQALYKKEPKAKFVGIERGLWPYVIARYRTRHIRSAKFKIILGDIFVQDLSQATVITTYLFPKLMEALLPKIQREVARGTRLYSVDFKFASKEVSRDIDLQRPAQSLGRRLFVYEF